MIERLGARPRSAYRLCLAAVAGLLACALLVAAGSLPGALSGILAGGAQIPRARTLAPAARTVASLPLTAQAAVSSALGAQDPAYALTTIGPAGSGFSSFSPAQRLAARFDSAGVHVIAGSLTLELSLTGLGRGARTSPLAAVGPTARGNRVSYARAGLTEWYANGPLGIEQGFVLARPPAAGSGPLTLALTLGGNAIATLAGDARSILLSRAGGGALRYGGLQATDARGRLMHSWLALEGHRLLLRVADRGAAYPLRIDPLVQQREVRGGPEENEIRGEKVVQRGTLGYSVALSADGNTALVGAPQDGASGGAAWVFVRSDGDWAQQGPKLTAGEKGPGEAGECGEETGPKAEGCAFGKRVALSADGNTALIGGPREKAPCPGKSVPEECRNQGAAWVFTRSGTTWSRTAALTGGPEEGIEGRFGRSVGLSADGSTAVVGASSDRGGRGSAWMFTQSGGSWTAGPRLVGEAAAGEAHFGGSVAISGDGAKVIVGGPGDTAYTGAVWAFANSGSGWAAQGGKLTGAEESGAAHFGQSVAMSADGSTALVGGRLDAGGSTGAAWVFANSGATWLQQGPKLTGGSEEASAEAGEFGFSVSLSADGSSALVGAPRDAGGVGAAFLFTRANGTWSLDGKLAGSKAHKGAFGSGVALRADGRTAVVGAPNEGEFAGAVWMFTDPGLIPLVSRISPSSGPPSGGTVVRLEGERLAGARSVRFGATPASFTANADGSLLVTAPASPGGALGPVCVLVSTAEGTSLCASYVYASPSTPPDQPPPPVVPPGVPPVSGAGSSAPGGGLVLGFGPVQSGAAGCGTTLLSPSIAVSTRARAAVRLLWSGTGTCKGTLLLRARMGVGRRSRLRTIATGTFTIIGGRPNTVALKLNALGRALLKARHGRLRAALSIVSLTPGPGQARTASVRLLAQRAHARRPARH
jgi:hypothetical protein